MSIWPHATYTAESRGSHGRDNAKTSANMTVKSFV